MVIIALRPHVEASSALRGKEAIDQNLCFTEPKSAEVFFILQKQKRRGTKKGKESGTIQQKLSVEYTVEVGRLHTLRLESFKTHFSTTPQISC